MAEGKKKKKKKEKEREKARGPMVIAICFGSADGNESETKRCIIVE